MHRVGGVECRRFCGEVLRTGTASQPGRTVARRRRRRAESLTLANAIDELAAAGFVDHFGVRDGALRSFDTGRRFKAVELVIREYHRFEGVSDPDDMSVVYGIEGQGGVRGTLVDAYGTYSDAAVSAFLQGVPIRGTSRRSSTP